MAAQHDYYDTHRPGKYTQYVVAGAQLMLLCMALFAHGIYIARSIGALETLVLVDAKKIEVLENRFCEMPNNYTTRAEHVDLKERMAIQRDKAEKSDAEMKSMVWNMTAELKGAIGKLSEKMDQHVDALRKH
jgi:hypothetical protein